MAYLGAIFILHQNTYSAFVTFSNLIFKSHILRSFYSFDLATMQNYYKTLESFIEKETKEKQEKLETITKDVKIKQENSQKTRRKI